ncbi:resuscitation-promoting factor [Streptomyces cylindrosporus]|uniref:Ubiquitin-like domain-containing protein n=1 Tax=Streptomyces cylindrosporus TaxID=2927583 RepID=A0ABS9Y9B1_9ACTN|nr:resuscitation-promoting factor [Streptomyces cylindrosporus]MCI3272506.1 ubiquitin-like domain-containing protein [Streptomyces cylindrosporus]
MSSSQYETYEAYGPNAGYPPPPAPDGFDVHSAQTLVSGELGRVGARGAGDAPGAGGASGAHGAESVSGAYSAGSASGAYAAGSASGAYGDTYAPAYEGRGAAEGALPRQAGRGVAEGAREEGVGAGVGRRGARRRRARYAERSDSTVRRLLPQALVVAFLAGGTTAFVAKDKAVELSVDGKPRTLHTFADDVTELLAQQGIDVGAHDVVAPAPGTALASGDEVAVRYGRPVRLTLDGTRREVWTTAHTVQGALDQLGVRAEGAYMSVSRSQPIGRAGLALDVRTERAVTVMADGRASTVRTNAATVREVVEEAGVTLRGEDTTSVPGDSFPRDGQTVTVLRVTGSEEVREEAIPFKVERRDDPSLFKGTEVVEQAGQPGVRRVTYALRTVNGVRQQPRKTDSEVVREPRTQVVRVGTKPLPTSVQGADGLNWHGLAACESGGRPNAVDPSGTYGGLYQFDTRTWHSLGGSGRPQDATAQEQTFRAKKLYVRRGASPWPHCGARLHG